MIVRYILLRLKTLNSRHFKCVSHQLVFYRTSITTYNIECVGYVIVTVYKAQFYLICQKSSSVLSTSPFRNISLTMIFYEVYIYQKAVIMTIALFPSNFPLRGYSPPTRELTDNAQITVADNVAVCSEQVTLFTLID